MKTSAHMQPDARIATPQLIQAMLAAADHVSDLIFSPGRAPQIESKGELIEVQVPRARDAVARVRPWRSPRT